ncbi:glucosamine-6-phosphate deaminase [Halanaerobiaceae bacterium Z-7014]|uniref:Glucosamine-6-phosphate deaminase n=1 Tax=Halonatronomonas betaini TaxID=2778430 RepID=A0A931F8H7_9FIRM|nr:glucosamine-6-phosphate deaminase [Halonatronomonas betaini]MBF8437741.1 glucosamine-6-phosphate deaminase [Halonatronomonas betaini]
MRVEIVKDYGKLSRKAARFVSGLIEMNPQAALGLPTGSTPLGLYEELVDIHEEYDLDFSYVKTFNLDEYIGLSRDHTRSYYNYLQENFIQKVNLKSRNTYFIDGKAPDKKEECNKYEEKILQVGGLDLVILGIGRNGHIGFNEPAEELIAKTHQVELAKETIEANSRFFESKEEVPQGALTMGVGTILNADQILLIANGNSKAAAIERLFSGKISTNFPASLLHTHPAVTVMIDQEAAERI